MQLWGPQRLILQAVSDLQGESSDFISDTKIAAHAKMGLGDVRNCLLTLEVDNLLSLARTTEGYLASVEAKGRLALSLPIPIPALRTEKGANSVKIRPKGLQSFDSQDADFFLELLPGPRGKDGLPESVNYWKSRIEERDADQTFRVGVIYGPSGCGKSSLVKAGLLPCLASEFRVIFVEATPQDTEVRLLNRLRKQCPDLPNDLGLADTLAVLGQKAATSSIGKVLLVLDQFEQWLSAKRDDENPELVTALRHCNGERLQAIVMVRVDFWMALTRFMAKMEIELRQGQNFAAIDLFDLRHATKVLMAFGQAFGALPDDPSKVTQDQQHFVQGAITELAENERITPVRLVLFAEMVKGKDWTPRTLKDVGGAKGIGVSFLEETFDAAQANPRHRLHKVAAQSLLKALLPENGTDIRGQMQSYSHLLEASGYVSRAKDFEGLLRILDSELRLITPTEPTEVEAQSGQSQTRSGLYYQLTHDYLVPSLRDWLTRKQKETMRGRAKLLLEDRAAVWNARPENRQLPFLWQWLNIWLLTQKKTWTPPQWKMMRKAAGYHAMRGLMLAALLTLISWSIYEVHGRLQAQSLVEQLLSAKISDVGTIVPRMKPYRPWIEPMLREEYSDAEAKKDDDKQLLLSLALLPEDDKQAEYLFERLLKADPIQLPVVRDALLNGDSSYRKTLSKRLWDILTPKAGYNRGGHDQDRRFRAACALAKYDADGGNWAGASDSIVERLLAGSLQNPSHYILLRDSLKPVGKHLIHALKKRFENIGLSESEGMLATHFLVEYAGDQPDELASLLIDANEKQLAVIYPKVKEQSEASLPILQAEIDKNLPPDLPSSDEKWEKLAKRQSNAAVALLKMNKPEKVWPLLKHSPDPRVRSYLIHRFGPLGTDAGIIVKRLDKEPDVTIRRALILSLGEFGEKDWSADERNAVIKKLQEINRTAADPGLHAASEWLLRHWKQDDWLRKVNDEWAEDKEEREKRIGAIKKTVAKEKTPPQWYVNGQGQTMVVIPGPVEFMMGSPPSEGGRIAFETQHKKRISRTFAIAAKPVTMEQFLKTRGNFGEGEAFVRQFAPTDDCPVLAITWHEAAEYCNWLSKKEGIDDPEEWCYEIKRQVAKLRKNYLKLSGYRLPTEAEMEYATRAGASTSRYYGETEELLPKYAWYQKNSKERAWPVGTLKPNDFGLFDVQGNVYTWCQDRHRAYPVGKAEEVTEDQEQEDRLEDTQRVLRGGSFSNPAWSVRSAMVNGNLPTIHNNAYGFRVARTLPLDDRTASRLNTPP